MADDAQESNGRVSPHVGGAVFGQDSVVYCAEAASGESLPGVVRYPF
jgi:hypothetical protein